MAVHVSRPPISMKFVLVLLLIIVPFLGIGVSPMIPIFEDFFVNGSTHQTNNPMFLEEVHLKVIKAYYNKTRGDQGSIS